MEPPGERTAGPGSWRLTQRLGESPDDATTDAGARRTRRNTGPERNKARHSQTGTVRRSMCAPGPIPRAETHGRFLDSPAWSGGPSPAPSPEVPEVLEA